MSTAGAAAPARPTSLPFPLQDGEQVLLMRRRHWLYLRPRLLLLLVVALLPPALVAFGLSAAEAYEGTVARIFWVIAAVWLLYWAVRLFLTWYRYQNDIWVITNQRLVDSLKTNPFNLQLSTADLVNVQDITVHRGGLVRTIFDFGDILCQTAAEQQAFLLAGIPDPRETQSVIDRERDRERLRYRA